MSKRAYELIREREAQANKMRAKAEAESEQLLASTKTKIRSDKEKAIAKYRSEGTALVDGSIVIEVADDGPGIPEANLDRIFDPFFTTKTVGKGTGLGLSICYGIVQRMGGDITVTSGPGKGTTFKINLPLLGD